MSTTTGDPLAAARTAVARLEWERGLRLFEEADASVEFGPEDLEAMAEAAWWTMRPDDAIVVLERAYAGFVRAHDNARAALVALTLSREHGAKREGSVATGWFNRASRHLASERRATRRRRRREPARSTPSRRMYAARVRDRGGSAAWRASAKRTTANPDGAHRSVAKPGFV
jgi:hypothetical protein